MDNQQRLYDLLNRVGNREITDEECAEIEALLASGDSADKVRLLLDQYYFPRITPQVVNTRQESWQNMLQAILNIEQPTQTIIVPPHRVYLLRTAWFRVAVAIILFLGIGGYFLLRDTHVQPVLAQTTMPAAQKDILPGTNRATLVLGDESIIELDTAANGLLTKQGGSEVIKTDNGEIVYSGGQINNTENIFYQKLITPRGGQYQVTLSDGTQVWLNAESSIRFPNIFNDKTRMVEITGEVYFEVKANKSQPFIVKTISEKITVLGTRFNVSAYAGEPFKTSLIVGAVSVNETMLPAGKAYVNSRIVNTNIQQDIAWKNGFFGFSNTSVDVVMQQLARWYDVDVVYDGKLPELRFTGNLQRKLTLSQVVRSLAEVDIQLELRGRTLHVLP